MKPLQSGAFRMRRCVGMALEAVTGADQDVGADPPGAGRLRPIRPPAGLFSASSADALQTFIPPPGDLHRLDARIPFLFPEVAPQVVVGPSPEAGRAAQAR